MVLDTAKTPHSLFTKEQSAFVDSEGTTVCYIIYCVHHTYLHSNLPMRKYYECGTPHAGLRHKYREKVSFKLTTRRAKLTNILANYGASLPTIRSQ